MGLPHSFTCPYQGQAFLCVKKWFEAQISGILPDVFSYISHFVCLYNFNYYYYYYFFIIIIVIIENTRTQRKKKLQALLQNIYKVSSSRSFTYSFYNNIMKVLHAKTFQ